MKKKLLSGILFSSAGSFWWGVIAVFYFKHVSFAGTLEIVVHRTIWTAFVLFLSIIFYSRWDFFFEILFISKASGAGTTSFFNLHDIFILSITVAGTIPMPIEIA